MADAYYGSATTTTNGTGASGRPKEVVELARALKNDPDLIYEYVRNNTTTTWTYGLSKGSLGVIVDRAGTSFDQAALMVDLLRESGYTASYKLGTITLSGTQFQAWTGITSAKAACQLLSSGGIPAIINGATTPDCSYTGTVSTIELGHAWVSVVIGGVSYVYDPAYKDHTFKTGVDLATATGMSSGMAIGLTASSDTSSGVPGLWNYQSATLASNLGAYASALETYINTNVASGGIADVVGGSVINPQAIPSGGLRQASLPYTSNVQHTITADIPDQYRIKLTLSITKARSSGTTTIVSNKVVYADEVYARRLTFEPNFDTTGASFTGTLKLTDDLGAALTLASASYSDDPSYSRGTVTVAVDLPYSASSGAYMDSTVVRDVSYALPFTIVAGFGDIGRGLIDKWGQRRDTAMPAIPDATCKVCFVSYKAWKGDGRRETLAAAWLAQSSRAGQLNAAIGKGIFAQHYAIGVSAADTVVAQTPNSSWWITDSFDRLDVETGFSLTSVSADATARRAAVLAAAHAISGLKGGVSGQISDLPDVATVASRIAWGNAPPSGDDPSGVGSRAVRNYSTSTQAAQTYALTVTEAVTTTTNTGVHADGASPTLGNTEVAARRQAVADAVSAYVTAGFDVHASTEAFLGPGQRAGAFAPSGSNYTHQQSRQRGGALVATKYDGNGDPVEVADVLVNPTGYADAGGGGAQTFHQAQYDPATSADVAKGRFVLQPPGTVIVGSPAKVSVGHGSFPYRLDGQLTWRGGDVRDGTYGPETHREPQGGWTTNFTNTLTISGSGLEAMGETDPRAAIGTIAAFYAAQDAYKSSPSLKREVAGQIITAWWLGTIAQNVATASIGTETRQWIRKPSGAWLTPGGATYGTLAQTGSAANSPRHPSGYATCTSNMLTYVPTRGWSYSGVAYTVTGARGDTQTFSNWTNQTVDTSGTPSCGEQRGFRLSTWAWLQGTSLTFTYARPGGYTTQLEALSSVSNTEGRVLKFNDGSAAMDAGNPTLMPVTVSQSGADYTHTDAVGAQTTFHTAIVGTGDFARLVMDKIFAADDATSPATQYVYDTLGRVAQSKDKLVLSGSRAPTQFFTANGLRSEVLDAAGYSSIIYADFNGRPVRTINSAGAVSTVAYDGRGRPTLTTSPDGDQVQLDYNTRNLVTKVTRLARAGSAEAGTSLVTETGYHATWNVPIWTKDAKGQQTDITYDAYANPTKVQLPSADGGATREEQDNYYYSDGLPMSVTSAMGQSMTNTYTNGTSWDTLTSTVGSTSGVSRGALYTNLGDPQAIVRPRGGPVRITYDALRRPVLIIQPYAKLLNCVSFSAGGASLPDSYAQNACPAGWYPNFDTSIPRDAKQLTYDLLGRVTKVELGTYLGTTFTPIESYTSVYDAVGNRIKQTGPAGIVQMSYDALNRRVCTAVRMNSEFFAALPADACQPSPSGRFGADRISRATYDAAGRVVQTEGAVGSSLQQVTQKDTYSPGGQRLTLSDANGNMSTFEYDGFGRLKKLRFPASPRGSGTSSTSDYEQWGYDANGNETSFRRRDGTTINYTYDPLNRIAVKDLPGTTTDDVYYSYANHGRSMYARLGSATATEYDLISVDQAGRLTSDLHESGVPVNPGISAAYDSEGNRVTAVYGPGNWGTATTATYDLADRLTAMTYTTWYGDSTHTLGTITYGPLNRRSSLTRANGVTTSYIFDTAGRLTGLSHSAPTPTDGSYQSFVYNPAGQLIASDQKSSQYVWSGQPTTTTNVTHDQLNRDAAIAAASGYDARGNLISDGTRTFTYDAENRLRSVVGGPANITLDYDGWGRLAKTTVGSTVTKFRYAGAQLAAEYDGSNNFLRSYVSGAGTDELLLWQEGSGSGAAAGTNVKWFEQDRLGSVISTSDSAGAITAYAYGPYGEPQSWSGSRFRYTGQMAIPEAQLYHYRARAYDPVMGRFLQTDPIGYGDGPNIYAYVHGDPVNGVDPSGDFCAGGRFGGDAGTPGGGWYFTGFGCVGYDLEGGLFPYTDPMTLPIRPAVSPTTTATNTLANIKSIPDTDECNESRRVAKILAADFEALSKGAGVTTGFLVVGDLALGLGELVTDGADTPITVGSIELTAFVGKTASATGGASAALNAYADGNFNALAAFVANQGLVSGATGIAKKIAENIPSLKKYVEAYEHAADKFTELVNKAEEGRCAAAVE